MRIKILITIAIIILLIPAMVLAIVSNSLAPAPAANPQRVTAVDPAEKGSRQAAQEIVRQCREVFDDNWPRQYELEWLWEPKALTISIYPSYFGAREVNYALRDVKYLNQWNRLMNDLQETAELIMQQFEAKGFPEATVRIDLYDNADPSLLLASVSNNGIDYDAVDSTPAGEQIGSQGAA